MVASFFVVLCLTFFQLRRDARLRKEFLYRKSLEIQEKNTAEQLKTLKKCLDEGIPIPRELRPVAGDLAKKITFDETVQGNTASSR